MFPTMTTTQQFTITPNVTNAAGKPAPVEGALVYGSSDESVVKVVPAADSLTALVVAQGVGDYTVSVSGDADLGEGVTTIVGQASGTVTLGQATSIGISAGPVEEQPAAPPASRRR